MKLSNFKHPSAFLSYTVCLGNKWQRLTSANSNFGVSFIRRFQHLNGLITPALHRGVVYKKSE